MARMARLAPDVVGDCIEKLHEKRRAVREEGMEALVAALQGFVPADDIDHRYFTVFDRCCASLLKGGAAEATLAYRAIGLLAVTVGSASVDGVDCSYDILHRVFPHLRTTLQAPSSGAATMVAVLDCLAAVTLAGARRALDAAWPMKAVMGVIRRAGDGASSPPPEVLTAALSTFALVLTKIGGVDLLTYSSSFEVDTIPFQEIVNLLDSDNPPIVMAAGEVLAVCAELNLTNYASPEDMDAIEMKVLDLAADARRDMTPMEERQVDFFQKIADIMCKGECTETEEPPLLSSGRGVLRGSTWARLVQLSFLKRFLGKGFRKHVQDNPLFGKEEDTTVDTDEDDELPAGKGWRHGGGKGKQWSSARRRDRDIKDSFNSFCG